MTNSRSFALVLLFTVVLPAAAFTSTLHQRTVLTTSASSLATTLFYSTKEDDKEAKPIQCFLIDNDPPKEDKRRKNKNRNRNENDDTHTTADDANAIPRVICTSEPDEYAWFNGIKRQNLVPIATMDDDAALSVVEAGTSPRGVPEWECESTFQ